jgi:hypothetical protein
MAFWSENWKYAKSNTNGKRATPSSEVMRSNEAWNCKFLLLSKKMLLMT